MSSRPPKPKPRALPPQHMAQVHTFARAWASWIGRRGGAQSVRNGTYLDAAEPFAAAFLAGLSPGGALSAGWDPAAPARPEVRGQLGQVAGL